MIVCSKVGRKNVKCMDRGHAKVGVRRVESAGSTALPQHRKPHSRVTGKAVLTSGLHGVSRPEIGTA